MDNNIKDSYCAILEKISKTKSNFNKKSYKVNFIAVSKSQPVSKIDQVLDLGHRSFGENRVQEAALKWINLKKKYSNIELHLIGSLQSNKVKEALQIFDVIQTLDREKLARRILDLSLDLELTPRLFIQVNTGVEQQKGGIKLSESSEFIRYCQEDLNLKIIGLMCIPPINENSENHFKILSKLRSDHKLKFLRMGMSDDYMQAIENGATHIRIGRNLFGDRL